jgi:DNA-binding CsgD family transcriptional regulator
MAHGEDVRLEAALSDSTVLHALSLRARPGYRLSKSHRRQRAQTASRTLLGAQIAADLHVSYKTIANTCSQLKPKLGVHSLPELMRIAIEHLPSMPSKALKE